MWLRTLLVKVWDTTRRHAKTTVDMPKGLSPSTCQTRLSPSTCKKCSRRHAKEDCLRWHAKRVSVDVPKWWCPSTCQEFVPVDMPKQRPIVSQPLNLETSATRLARVVSYLYFHEDYMLHSCSTSVLEILSALFLTIYLAFYRAMSRLWLQILLACDSKVISPVTPKSSSPSSSSSSLSWSL